MTMHFDGTADFLYPDGTHTVATVHAGQRGGRWAGTIRLTAGDRRLERGDVCRLTHGRFEGELRIVITEQTGTTRYAFIGLIKPDPWESL
ncbi:MAG: hypothetical protein ACRDJE_05675 [Dehalococcoidia bacterium]